MNKETIANVNISGQKGIFRYPGSKNKAAPEIISYFPDHNLFAEVFGGSAAVLVRKPISRVEIYNDIRSELVNLFQVLVYHFEEFKNKAQFMINSREWFYDLKKDKFPNDDPIDKAFNTYYMLKFGFAGRMSGWPLSINQNSRPSVDLHFLKKVSKRFEKVQITDYDYNKCILDIQEKNIQNKILYYLDPPYPDVGKNLYPDKFDNAEFEKFLNEIKDPWILSYPIKLENWYSVEIPIQYSLKKREIVTEYLMSNFPLVKRGKTSKLGEWFK